LTYWPIFRTGVDRSRAGVVPNIRYGTEQYPPKVARRLRALNITTWSAAAVGAVFAVSHFLDPAPSVWKVGLSNAIGSLALAMIPLLNRLGPRAAPAAFATVMYTYIFVVCRQIGTGSEMQIQYLAVAAATILFLGTESIALVALFGVVAVALIIVLEITVPRETGLVASATLFRNFLFGVTATCAVLFTVVFYAVREAARAEASAEHEFARSEALLKNILPVSVVEQLKEDNHATVAQRYDEASVLFADMAGFTARSATMPPERLVRFLDHVFTTFDSLVERHNLEKIKTTGDSYMVVAGLPLTRQDHASALARFALEMAKAATTFRDPDDRGVPFRIGIASGPVVAGVVGTRKFFYDVWGDTVNLAARMETTGVPGKIQVTQQTYEALRATFVLESRGQVDVKGRGLMQTWFLEEPAPVAGGAGPQGAWSERAEFSGKTGAARQD
jgi:adenylate cyclase